MSLARRGPTSNNERLPFDVLGLIFQQYSLGQTDPEPLKLETLLLVCRAWTLAALGHKALWSNFDITIHSSESLRYWHHHIPLRTTRCSPTRLFDIQISLVIPSGDFNGGEEGQGIHELLASIVLDLTGAEGQIATRWRSLRAFGCLHLPYAFSPLLSFPTPNLIEMEIELVRSQDQCLLEVPILEKLSIRYCQLPQYPDLRNVTDLIIGAEGWEEFDEEAVFKAKKLTRLSVYCNSTFTPLRGDFPFLEFLQLSFVQDDLFLESFSAPHLKTLSLYYGDGQSHYLTSCCLGIPFHALEELELAFDQGIVSLKDLDEADYGYIDGISLILNAAVNIKELRTRHRGVVICLLELLENVGEFLDHHFTLKYLEFTMELCQGQKRLDRITAFRSEARLEEEEGGVESEGEEESSGGEWGSDRSSAISISHYFPAPASVP